MTTHSFAFAAVCATGLATIARAQTVWNVTAANGIQPAIAAASPGDVIVLTAGPLTVPFDYDLFTLDKGVTIIGNGARIGSWGQGVLPVSVPAGQVAHVSNLSLASGWGSYGINYGVQVHVQGGSVRFDACTFRAGAQDAIVAANAEVVVTSSPITVVGYGQFGTGRPLVATNASITLRDCQLTAPGSSTGPTGSGGNWAPPRSAVWLSGSKLHAERSTFTGGSHANGSIPTYLNGAHAMEAQNSLVWLADCTVTAGNTMNTIFTSGGTALVNNGGPACELRGTTLVAGTPNGAASSGPIDANAPLVTAALSQPWTRGATSTLTVTGGANAFHAVFVTPVSAATSLPLIAEPVWAAGAFAVIATTLDALGVAVHAVAVPNVAALQHAPVWCQCAMLSLSSSPPLRASTITGGVVR